MNILISGSTGFIGKHLLRRLLKNKIKPFAIIRPSTNADDLISQGIKFFIFTGDIEALADFIKINDIKGIIHLASLFLASHQSDDIKNLIESNINFSTSLLEASVKSEVKWFINTGTFWQHYNNADYSPVNLYSAMKQAFEDISKYYIETSNINFVTIKLNDTFGQEDTRPKIFNLWNKISQTGETLDMSPGDQIMDISYIDNVIDGYEQMIKLLSQDFEKQLNGKSFAIKSNEYMTLKELAKLYENTTGKKLNINWGKREYREHEVMIPWNKGEIIPGWEQKISLKEGIKKTMQNE